MHDRSNGLGGGFAAYGIYPEYKNLYALHVFYQGKQAKDVCEAFINEHFDVVNLSKIPTRKTPKIKDEPLIWRYFVEPLHTKLAESQLDEDTFVSRCVIRVNSQIDGAYIFSSGKDMGVFKAVGYPEDVGEFYRLEDYKGYCWTAHGRYPTNTPGWWGGAHPFALLDRSVVHNGEISSYDANRRAIEMYGYQCNLLTDTEVITYIIDVPGAAAGGSPTRRRPALSRHPSGAPSAAWRKRKGPHDVPAGGLWRDAYHRALLHLVGFTGGILALNDRLKLRSMVVGERGDTVYIASEESAIRAIEPELDTLYYPRGGEPVVYRVNQGALPEERR